jgi:hypothetical protein
LLRNAHLRQRQRLLTPVRGENLAAHHSSKRVRHIPRRPAVELAFNL